MSNSRERHERFVLEGGCPYLAFEEAEVTVPITVRASADVHNAELNCAGVPRVTYNSDRTPGTPGAVSRFTVSQRLRVEIPIVFNAEADVGEGHVDFDRHDGCHDRGIERGAEARGNNQRKGNCKECP